ncbi:MAG TPA: heterodisulfide reductase-related iron-sulfur binding cluster [Methylomirabilota bacterium]|nr:heterodisulfide reductase-related iron-sulfur binding cluster [Methylomirabilota bacterium]
MSDDTDIVSYQPTAGLSYDPADPVYWDRDGLAGELRRTFAICHGCRLCFKYCDVFPNLFDLIDRRHQGEIPLITLEATAVLDDCFQCKLCEVNCPYTVRDGHEYRLDFPKLVHRQRAVQVQACGRRLRDRLLGDPDRAGRVARASLGLANLASRSRMLRWLLEKAVGIHRGKLLPPFARRTFEDWARRTGRLTATPPAEVVLFQTCFVQHNAPEIGADTVEVLERNGVTVRCVAGLRCCGMPAWEKGDLAGVQAAARDNLRRLRPFVEQGARIVAINPTCSMMLRREYPGLVDPADREAAARVAAATMDPAEFLWGIRDEPRFNTAFQSAPEGTIAYHVPCHLRAQGIGFKSRDLLRKIPGVRLAMVMECSGHDGTYAMTVEGFEPSRRIGIKAFAAMQVAEASVWTSDCPLAALQFAQHAGAHPLHPMSVLARAYRPDGFPRRLAPAPAAGPEPR